MSEPTYEIDTLIFETEPYHGHTVKAFYLKAPHETDAMVNILKDENQIKSFTFPAYKVWNIAAHYREIVDSEINDDSRGMREASWDGISGGIFFLPKA